MGWRSRDAPERRPLGEKAPEPQSKGKNGDREISRHERGDRSTVIRRGKSGKEGGLLCGEEGRAPDEKWEGEIVSERI